MLDKNCAGSCDNFMILSSGGGENEESTFLRIERLVFDEDKQELVIEGETKSFVAPSEPHGAVPEVRPERQAARRHRERASLSLNVTRRLCDLIDRSEGLLHVASASRAAMTATTREP